MWTRGEVWRFGKKKGGGRRGGSHTTLRWVPRGSRENGGSQGGRCYKKRVSRRDGGRNSEPKPGIGKEKGNGHKSNVLPIHHTGEAKSERKKRVVKGFSKNATEMHDRRQIREKKNLQRGKENWQGDQNAATGGRTDLTTSRVSTTGRGRGTGNAISKGSKKITIKTMQTEEGEGLRLSVKQRRKCQKGRKPRGCNQRDRTTLYTSRGRESAQPRSLKKTWHHRTWDLLRVSRNHPLAQKEERFLCRIE